MGMIVHFSQKTNVSISLVCMVNHSAIEHHESNRIVHELNENCLASNQTNHLDGPYVWNKNVQGFILSAYFGGYIVTQIPAGYIAGRYGARFLFSGAIFTSSLVTIFMPIVSSIHWMLFSALQVLVGLAHGTIWPCMAVIMSHWAPANERGKLMGFMNAGAQIGNVLTLSIGGLMCSWSFLGGWPMIFYSVGIFGLLWSFLWLIIYSDSPCTNRYISNIEKDFLIENTHRKSAHQFQTPWRSIFRSSSCWALFLIHTCHNWGTYTFLTSIPKYMDE